MNGRDLVRGAALGAALTYLLDRRQGKRRRTLVKDKLVHASHKAQDGAGAASRDLEHRVQGWIARAKSRLRRASTADAVLEARVRSKLGRLVSHPGAIQVVADDGSITLCGPVLERELGDVVAGASSVRGVKSVENRLEAHARAEHVPGLQDGHPRGRPRPEFLQSHWAPGARVLAGALGGGLIMRGLRAGGLTGAALTSAGTALLTRAITNLEMKRLTGIRAGRRAVDIRKTLNVQAPVDRVFDFWQNHENFPRFMSHLKQVRRTGDGRSHWVAEGPGGVSVEWDAETTALDPNRLIAWRSIEGSPVENAGIVRFLPNEQGGTRVDVRLTYNPPAGAMGHALASLFGTDPKHLMDEDLVRFQSLLELGKTTARGDEVTREEIEGGARGGLRRST